MRGARALRVGGLALLGLLAVWAMVVLYWRGRGIEPTVGHLVVGLVLLPLALVIAFLLVRRLRRGRRNAAAPAAAAPTDEPSTDTVPVPDRVLYLLSSAAWLRAGGDGKAIAEALREPQRPPLHGRLKDRLGLPVFAAEVEGLDPLALEAALHAVLAERDATLRPEQVFGEEVLRAFALLGPVAEDLLYAALPPATPGTEDALPTAGLHPHAMHHSRSSRAPVAASSAAVLQIRVLLPAAWSPPARQAGADWLRAKARTMGFDEESFRIDVSAVATSADTWRLIERLATGPADDDRQLLLATHSLIGESSIERLDFGRELLVSGHPEGLIPGEGAAGLLLAAGPPGSQDDAGDAPFAPLRLHRIRHGRAGQGRAAGREAAGLLRAALDTAAHPAEAIALVFSDADHRPSRAIEIAGAVSAALPELEPVDDTRHLGLACGETGAVAPLALLATAAAQVAADGAPVLAAGLADRDTRFALVLSPMPVDSAADAQAAATPTHQAAEAAPA